MTMRGGREQVVLIHALMKTGSILLPVSPKLSEQERVRALKQCKVSVDLDEPDRLTQTEADMPLLGEHDMEDIHCRILTSGSSGTAHAVGLTYGNHLFSAMGSAYNIGVDPTDRWLCALPLSHISGLSIVMRSVIYGTAIVLHDRFDIDRVAASFQHPVATGGQVGTSNQVSTSGQGVTVVSMVSTMLLRLLDAGADLSAPRAILVGGGPVPRIALERALDLGANVIQTYGLTETCSQVTTLEVSEARRKVGSVGRPLLTSHLRILDGEILVQGPTVSSQSLDSDGWLHTGDIGQIDDDGFLYVDGRIDDMIITGGENVVPSEVEEVLVQHPEVLEAAVVGRPDPEWNQAVTAVLVLTGGGSVGIDELRSHCSSRLASYKVPKRFEIVESLPRTPSGKILRASLR